MRRASLALVTLLAALPAAAGDGPDVAALGPAPSETIVAVENANPFGLPPLSALSATRERPLFSATRRPPPAAVSAPESPPPPPPAAEAPSEPQHVPFTLVGTLLGPGQGIAWLQDPAQTLHKLRQGESDSGWTLSNVGPRSVTFEKDGISETIALPKSAQAAIVDPDADAAPLLPTAPVPLVRPTPGRGRTRGDGK